MDQQTLEQAFREAMSRFASTLCVLTCRDRTGLAHGMAATAVTSLSLDPVSILACVNLGSTFYEGLMDTDGFAVNILSDTQSDQSRIFGSSSFREERFLVGRWQDDPDTGAPLLAGSQANLICQPEQIHSYGSHAIIAARVLRVAVSETIGPLVYLNRNHVRLVAV